MPRMPIVTPKDDRIQEKPKAVRPVNPVQPPKKEFHRDNTSVYIQPVDFDLKLKVLAEDTARTYLPLDFDNNSEIEQKTAEELADTAYIFVDNNGKPTKVLATSVLRTFIKWNDLADSTKTRIQQAIDIAIESNKLKAGDNITIENNIISANIGVASLNGKIGSITLSAEDLNAYTKDKVYTKDETQDIINNLIIEVDGGRIE